MPECLYELLYNCFGACEIVFRPFALGRGVSGLCIRPKNSLKLKAVALGIVGREGVLHVLLQLFVIFYIFGIKSVVL